MLAWQVADAGVDSGVVDWTVLSVGLCARLNARLWRSVLECKEEVGLKEGGC